MKPLLILTLCLFVLPSCASTWRTLGVAPLSDLDDHRVEEAKQHRVIVTELGDAIEGKQTVASAQNRIEDAQKKSDDDWARRPEPPNPPWVELGSAVILGILGLYGHVRTNRSIAETDKWVEEIEKKSQPVS